MTELTLKSIEIEGLLSIRSTQVVLGQLNLLVGANGAGKSNLVRAFEMLGRIADEDLSLFVGLNGGASTLIHDGDARIRLAVTSSVATYEATLLAGADEQLIFESEAVHLSDTVPPRQYGLGSGQRESSLRQSARGDLETPLAELLGMLHGCRVYHFDDTSPNAPVKQNAPTADNLTLRSDAGNLAAVLLHLREADSVAYRRVLGAIQQVAPFFRDFVLQPDSSDRIRLRWRQMGSDAVFSAHQMSDGTLRFICLATLLLQPELPGVLVLDEPELGLHPFAIVQLAELLRQAATRSQVLLATQSVTLISQFELQDVLVAERKNGASVFDRPDPGTVTAWLADYRPGYLKTTDGPLAIAALGVPALRERCPHLDGWLGELDSRLNGRSSL